MEKFSFNMIKEMKSNNRNENNKRNKVLVVSRFPSAGCFVADSCCRCPPCLLVVKEWWWW